jgi:hypothetical protein
VVPQSTFGAKLMLRRGDNADAESARRVDELAEDSDHAGVASGCDFSVAVRGDKVLGTFGLERASDDAMELWRINKRTPRR